MASTPRTTSPSDGELPVVVVDTREQEPYSFDPARVTCVRRALPVGDYSLEGYEAAIAIERKSLEDFVASTITARVRFRGELRGLGEYDLGCVVVEGSLEDILARRYRSGAHPSAVVGAALSIRRSGFGNLVWLPWWQGAADGGNSFYRRATDGALEAYVPTEFATASPDVVDRLLAAQTPPPPPSQRTQNGARAPETPTNGASDPAWAEWRRRVLAALPVEAVYGTWLTGKPAGPGWLECRDPSSATGDQNPSASVADGSGDTPPSKYLPSASLNGTGCGNAREPHAVIAFAGISVRRRLDPGDGHQ